LADLNQRKAFLREVKRLISRGQKDFIKRTYDHPSGTKVRWIEALMEIGLTNPEQAWDEALKLSPSHYVDGPCVDVDRPKDGKVIWIFKKEVNGVLTYIKMKIDRRGCVCLSFHKDW
jgi:hypothetical protein